MELQQPYFAVIFTNRRTEGDNGYAQMAEDMEKLARQQPRTMAGQTKNLPSFSVCHTSCWGAITPPGATSGALGMAVLKGNGP